MSEGPLPPLGRIDRSQGPWDTRNVAELSQTSFRTTLRGFDRSEVRALLDSIAADYRVLQLQNASLLRQLADLEGVLQAYRREEGTVAHTLQKANDEARAILTRAQAQAEETMARVSAMVREAESPLAPIENGHGNIQVTLASTVAEMLAILRTAERSRFEFGTRQEPSVPVMSDAPVSTAAATTESEPAVSNDTNVHQVHAESRPVHVAEAHPTDREERNAPSGALVPISFVPRRVAGRSGSAAAPPSTTRDTAEPIEAILKKIDKAMLDIPSLTRE